ncbi:MAG: hypothetical protein HY216_05965 [Candidatus Rokubacteria bacterium]|nr:hypothetical protein [Candidatus Rokubacteria bacterium]
MPLPIIGSLLLSIGVKLGVDYAKKIWDGRTPEPQTAGGSPDAQSFGEILKDRTAAIPTATDVPTAPPMPSMVRDGLADLRNLGLEDSAAVLLYGANRNTGSLGGDGQGNDAIASYLRNVPQTG